MALNAKPVLSTISAFDAEFGTPGKENIPAPILKFSWKDGVVKKNKVVIRDYNTNEEVYNCTIETMALKHQLHNQYDISNKTQLVTYSLQNGCKYIANVYVYTSDGEESLASNDVIFYCFDTPTFIFTNFDTHIGEGTTTAVINASSVHLTVRYTQINEEPLNSYHFELQDYNGNTLLISETKYSSLADDILRYTIGGIEETPENKYGDLQINQAYKIICSGETQHGIIVYVEQKFVVKPETSGVGALIYAENSEVGNVSIYSNYKLLDVNCSMEDPIYLYDENGNPYAIDLNNNEYVEFTGGFLIKSPYEVVVSGIFNQGKLITFTNTDGFSGHLELRKITYTIYPYYYFCLVLERDGFEYEVRSEYFICYDDTVNAQVDVCYLNGLYSVKANVILS